MLLEEKQVNSVRQKMMTFRSSVRVHIKLDWRSYKYPVFFNSYHGRTDLIFKNVFNSANYETGKNALTVSNLFIFPNKLPYFLNTSRLQKVRSFKLHFKVKISPKLVICRKCLCNCQNKLMFLSWRNF